MTKLTWAEYARTRNLSRNRLLLARHAELVDYFLRTFSQVDNNKRVLDIGPANGLFMVLLRELGFDTIDSLEVSPVFRDVLRTKGLKTQEGDIMTGAGLEHLSPPYDVVLLMEVLEHVEHPLQALQHVRQLLANDGFAYITVPLCDCIFDRAQRIVFWKTREDLVKGMDETHLHAFSAGGLRSLAAQAGCAYARQADAG